MLSYQKVTKAIKNPHKAISYIHYKVSQEKYYSDFSLLAVERAALENYGAAERKINSEFQSLSGQTRGKNYSPGTISENDAEILKGFIISQNPSVVVETGVCNGISTLSILEGLEDDSSLYSIDLPETPESDEEEFWSGKGGSIVPSGKQPGWVIPDSLRDKWELILGNSMYKLPKLLKELDEIDVFIHDSEHSYEMMMFEFCIAWKHLKEGGYLICDDHNWNNAFHDFAREKNLTKYRIGNLGLLQK